MTASRTTFRPTRLALALFAALPFAAAADTASDADTQARSLDTVVVTAAGFEQKLVDAPASISVLSREDLEERRYINLAQALADVEGIDINQGTGKTGGLNISIRGMPSEYTLILIDGRRQNNSGDITPNGFGETSTSFMPPMSAIERIEVIRGPMSTLYGSDAMGGVVNIITRRVPATWGGSVSLNHTIQENRDYGETSGSSAYFAGPVVEDLLGLAVRGSVTDRGASDLSFDDGSVVSRRGAAAVEGRIFDIGARLSLTPDADHDVYLDVERGRQVYNNDNCQLGTLDGRAGNATAGCTATPNTTAAGYADELRFQRDQVALGYRGTFDIGRVDASLTRRATETIGRTVPGTIGMAWTGFPGIVGGAPRELESTDTFLDAKLVSSIGDAHTLTVGGQFIDADVTDGLTTETFNQRSWALFAENEWRPLEPLAITLGARYDHHDAFGGHVSPRLYAVWTASEQWTIKGGVSEGYKAPTVNELHDGINGATGQGTVITIGTPTLQPETSRNTEIGVYFDNGNGFNANVTLFENRFEDRISTGTPVPNCFATGNLDRPGCIGFGPGFTQDSFAQAVNIGEARTSGVELAGRWAFAQDWSVAANYTYSDSEQKTGVDAGAPLTNTPLHMLHATLRWSATDNIDLWFKGEYTSERDRFTNLYPNLTPANRALIDGIGQLKAYETFQLGGTFRASESVSFTAAIHNLFDKDFLDGRVYRTNTGANAWASYYVQAAQSVTGALQEGRRLWLAVNVAF